MFPEGYDEFLIREAINFISMNRSINPWDPQYVWLQQARAYLEDRNTQNSMWNLSTPVLNPCAEVFLKGSDVANHGFDKIKIADIVWTYGRSDWPKCPDEDTLVKKAEPSRGTDGGSSTSSQNRDPYWHRSANQAGDASGSMGTHVIHGTTVTIHMEKERAKQLAEPKKRETADDILYSPVTTT